MAGGWSPTRRAAHGVASCRSTASTTPSTSACTARDRAEMTRLILTASGGPFRGWPQTHSQAVTAEDALQHPTWRMGQKITIDSATLMNKGLEVIEAHWLFGVPPDRDRRASMHPQSIVHSMVELMRRVDHRAARRDRHAAADPVRVLVSGTVGGAAAVAGSGARRRRSSSPRPIEAAFPCLGLAYAALEAGAQPAGRAQCGQRDRRSHAFLEGRLGFPAIPAGDCRGHGCARAGKPRPRSKRCARVDAWARDPCANRSWELELKV